MAGVLLKLHFHQRGPGRSLYFPLLSYIFKSRLGLKYIAISTENIREIFFFSGISINEMEPIENSTGVIHVGLLTVIFWTTAE